MERNFEASKQSERNSAFWHSANFPRNEVMQSLAEIKKEMENIIAHHAGADRFRVRMYVETFLTNELVFQFLEEQN